MTAMTQSKAPHGRAGPRRARPAAALHHLARAPWRRRAERVAARMVKDFRFGTARATAVLKGLSETAPRVTRSSGRRLRQVDLPALGEPDA
jgi:hypothetical protein